MAVSQASAPTFLPQHRAPAEELQQLDGEHEHRAPLVTSKLILEAEEASPTCLDLHLLQGRDDMHTRLESISWQAVKESLRAAGIDCPVHSLSQCVWQELPALRIRLELRDVLALHKLRDQILGHQRTGTCHPALRSTCALGL